MTDKKSPKKAEKRRRKGKPRPSVLPVGQTGEGDCGPCCVVYALALLGDIRKPGEVIESLHANPIDGTDPRTIESYLRSQGYFVQSGEMDIDDLDYHASQGRVCICVTRGHYVVARGIERNKHELTVQIMDSWGGKMVGIPADYFLDVWDDVDRLGARYRSWGIVVGKSLRT